MKYEVVIIGAGLGGLTSALTLAKAGKKVAVVEKHFKAGGYATNFIRKGNGHTYKFDVSLHSIGNLKQGRNLNNYLKNLGIYDELSFIKKSETSTVLYNDKEIDIPDSFEEYKEVLKVNFPENKEDVEKIFSVLKEYDEDMNKVFKENKIPKYITEFSNISLKDFLSRYTNNKELIEVFSYLWAYYGLPNEELSAYYYLTPWLSYHIGGTYYIEGGSQKLSDVLVDKIKSFGGEIFLSNEVIDIKTSNGKISKIITQKGLEIEGDKFIFNGDPRKLLELTESNDKQFKLYREKLSNLKVGASLTQLYIGLDCKPSEVGINKADYFTLENSSTENYKFAKEGNFNVEDMCITNYSIMDPSLEEKTGIICLCLVDFIENWPERNTEEYKRKKEVVTYILLSKLYKYFPKAEGHIVLTELATPVTMKRYTNNSKGAVYGWEQNINQSGFNRIPLKSNIENLYLAGSWSQPGGGYEGAIISGTDCANKILRDIEKEKNLTLKAEKEEVKADMPLETYLIGMVAQFKKEKAQGIKNVYKFIFDQEKTFYISVDRNKAKLHKGSEPLKEDITIETSYDTWFQIGQGDIEGEEALRSGLLKVKGDLEIFMNIPRLFTEEKIAKISEKKIIKGNLYLTLTLVPWIIFWIFNGLVKKEVISAIGIIYTLIMMFYIKPKEFREVTKLEGINILAFGLYGISNTLIPNVYSILGANIINIIFIIGWLISIFSKSTITEEYAKYSYSEGMAKTRLFKEINRKITLMWSIIYIIQIVTITVIESPLKNLIFLLSLVGIIISEIFPKYKIKVI